MRGDLSKGFLPAAEYEVASCSPDAFDASFSYPLPEYGSCSWDSLLVIDTCCVVLALDDVPQIPGCVVGNNVAVASG